jgi:hypothetical protein
MFQKFTGLEYLKIDIANSWGLSKLTWDERLKWFNDNESKLAGLISSAKEPALFYAGIKAYYEALKGEPIGYTISLDATSSGLQLLAVLTGDRSAAQICNVVDTGTREDAYQIVYRTLISLIGSSRRISPEDVKQAVMTAFYSSKAVPKQVFGEGELLDLFYQCLEALAPAAWELNETMLKLWDHTALEHSWILPDNFHVRIKVMAQIKETVNFLGESYDVFYNVNVPMEGGRSLGANMVHSIDGMIVREITRRCDYDPRVVAVVRSLFDKGKGRGGRSSSSKDDRLVIALWRQFQDTGYLSARILDHLNLDNSGHVNAMEILQLCDSLPDKPFKVVSIHDCFRCLPHYGNDLRHQYNLQLQLISKSNLLGSIISQLIGRKVRIGKLDPGLHLDVIDTNYALS